MSIKCCCSALINKQKIPPKTKHHHPRPKEQQLLAGFQRKQEESFMFCQCLFFLGFCVSLKNPKSQLWVRLFWVGLFVYFLSHCGFVFSLFPHFWFYSFWIIRLLEEGWCGPREFIMAACSVWVFNGSKLDCVIISGFQRVALDILKFWI